jgi:hypothetical protein
MSQETRDNLVAKLVFQKASQRSDLLDDDLTQTYLIGLLDYLAQKGWNMEITAVRTDHSDDSHLGFHCHAHGFCADLWPLASDTPGDYLDASDPRFQQFLTDAAGAPFLYQIGLAGTADTLANRKAAGPTVFSDGGADHLHLGSQE